MYALYSHTILHAYLIHIHYTTPIYTHILNYIYTYIENDDYKGMDPKQAKEDFMNRVHAYEKVYQVSIYVV